MGRTKNTARFPGKDPAPLFPQLGLWTKMPARATPDKTPKPKAKSGALSRKKSGGASGKTPARVTEDRGNSQDDDGTPAAATVSETITAVRNGSASEDGIDDEVRFVCDHWSFFYYTFVARSRSCTLRHNGCGPRREKFRPAVGFFCQDVKK